MATDVAGCRDPSSADVHGVRIAIWSTTANCLPEKPLRRFVALLPVVIPVAMVVAIVHFVVKYW